MTKTRIGIDTDKENKYIISIEAKKKRFTDLYDYCQQFISIEDIKAFSENPNEYFKTAFNTKYENDFPPLVNYAKRLELCSISENKILDFQSKYQDIKIDNFDCIKLTAPTKDFGIYAIDSEAEKRYKNTKKLTDLLNELRNDFQVYPANIIQGVSGAIAFSFQTNKFEININFINQIKSRSY